MDEASGAVAEEQGEISEVGGEEEEPAREASFSPDLKIFVGNLPFSCDSATLAGLFESSGNVEMVEVHLLNCFLTTFYFSYYSIFFDFPGKWYVLMGTCPALNSMHLAYFDWRSFYICTRSLL